MSRRSGVSSDVLPLPSGAGSIAGLGDRFSPDLHTGIGKYSVPLPLPRGRAGLEPRLALVYNSGFADGPFGLGWRLTIPSIARSGARGVPRYQAGDEYTLDGSRLIEMGGEAAAVRFALQPAGAPARIRMLRDGGRARWEVRTPDGITHRYGTAPTATDPTWRDPAAVADPDDPARVVRWMLASSEDPFGNRVEYEYERDPAGLTDDRPWDQLYPKEIRYAEHGDRTAPRFLIVVRFRWETRPVPSSEFRAGFEVRTTRRCARIEVSTVSDEERTCRSFPLRYVDQLEPEPDRRGNGEWSAAIETRTWFHQGVVDRDGDWFEPDFSAEYWTGDAAWGEVAALAAESIAGLDPLQRRDALRCLRGRPLRTEVYQLDGAPEADRPMVVTEFGHGARVDDVAPATSEAICFPHVAAERSTRWDRGDEPMTRLRVAAYDGLGQLTEQLEVGVPRGRDPRVDAAPGAPYLASQRTTRFAVRDDATLFSIRPAIESAYEIENDGSPSLPALVAAVRAGFASRRIIGQSVHRYDGPAFEGLPPGELGAFAALVRSDELVLTEPLIAAAYGADAARFLLDGTPPAPGAAGRLSPVAERGRRARGTGAVDARGLRAPRAGVGLRRLHRRRRAFGCEGEGPQRRGGARREHRRVDDRRQRRARLARRGHGVPLPDPEMIGDGVITRRCAVVAAACSMSACSFLAVVPPPRPPPTDPTAPIACSSSRWSAFVDVGTVIAAGATGIALAMSEDDPLTDKREDEAGQAAAPVPLVLSVGAVVSAFYGFRMTSRCRHLRRIRALAAPGG